MTRLELAELHARSQLFPGADPYNTDCLMSVATVLDLVELARAVMAIGNPDVCARLKAALAKLSEPA